MSGAAKMRGKQTHPWKNRGRPIQILAQTFGGILSLVCEGLLKIVLKK